MKKYWNLLTCLFILAFTAACTGNSGSGDPTDEGNGEGTLTLKASATYIENNGTDAAVFTVLKGDKDVTDQAAIYQKKGSSFEQFSGTTFTSTTTGEYSFFASYNGEMSTTITVTVIGGMLELPADPQPAKFDGFKHRILALQGTSLGCTYCPMMIAGLTEYEKTEEYKSTVVAAAHGVMSGDDMISTYSNSVLKETGISNSGIPALLFNLQSSSEIMGIFGSDSPASVCGRIQSEAQEQLKTAASTGISAAVSGTEASGSLSVTASVKVGQTGKYRVSAWVVEDDIYAKGQMNGYPSLEETYDFTHHSNVLRCISSTSPITGGNLGGKEECQAGETQMFVHEFDLNSMDIENLSNVRVLIIVSRNASGSRYTVDNVISCGVNKSVAFEYE